MISAGKWRDLFEQPRDTYLLGLLRTALAVCSLANTAKLFREYRAVGYFGDFFHLPLLPEALVPSREVFLLLLATQALCAVAAFLGVIARPALFTAALSSLYLITCDRLHYHNNRYVLQLVCLLCALAPSDRSFLLWKGRSHALPVAERMRPLWLAALLGAQLSLVYLASTFGKLLDSAWRSGDVLFLRFVGAADFVQAHGVSLGALDGLLRAPFLAVSAAKAAIATELFLALGLWSKRTRPVALWVGVLFHVGIELAAHVELFSYVMLSCYVVFARPELRERTLRFAAGSSQARRWVKVLSRLDWLQRFRLEPAAAPGAAFSVVDREGREHQRWPALRELARATPLLFPLWLPLAVVAFWRERRDRASIQVR